MRNGVNFRSQPLDQATSYCTRMRGIDAEESAMLLIQSGLLVRLDDPRVVLRRMKVNELTEFLTRQGIEGVKGSRKEKLIARSRERFATPRAIVEDRMNRWMA